MQKKLCAVVRRRVTVGRLFFFIKTTAHKSQYGTIIDIDIVSTTNKHLYFKFFD